MINAIERARSRASAQKIAGGLFAVFAAVNAASAQDKKNEISFDLAANPAVVECLRANYYEEPRAHGAVPRAVSSDRQSASADLEGQGLDQSGPGQPHDLQPPLARAARTGIPVGGTPSARIPAPGCSPCLVSSK